MCGPGEPRNSLDDQLPLVYEELRRLAASYLRRERSDHTLQPTSLVHEAYLRLLQQRETGWSNRAQLIGLAASMMRRILVNYAQGHAALKRGGGSLRMSIDEPESSEPSAKPPSSVDLLALDQALDQLAQFHPECARIVEMKYFGGLNFEEVAEVLGITERTVQRHWRTARAWLFTRLSP